MTYATPQDLIAKLGEREALALSDRLGTGQVDMVALTLALNEASDEIDAYVGRRYLLPLADASGNVLTIPPTVLTRVAIDIVRYRMTGTEIMETEPIRIRFRDAIRLCEQIAKGEINLGNLMMAAAGGPAAVGGVNAVITKRKTFDMRGVL